MRSRCQECWCLLRALRMNLFYTSLLAYDGGWHPGHPLACSIPIPASIFTWHSSSVSVFSSSYKNTSHVELGSTLLQYDLILTNYICKDSTYNLVPFTSTGGQDFNISFLEDRLQPTTEGMLIGKIQLVKAFKELCILEPWCDPTSGRVLLLKMSQLNCGFQ